MMLQDKPNWGKKKQYQRGVDAWVSGFASRSKLVIILRPHPRAFHLWPFSKQGSLEWFHCQVHKSRGVGVYSRIPPSSNCRPHKTKGSAFESRLSANKAVSQVSPLSINLNQSQAAQQHHEYMICYIYYINYYKLSSFQIISYDNLILRLDPEPSNC